ncbi:hypothetical protein [Sulfurivirga sp.]|uniref:hypothetical protein n=1 Tax=Sulfurivirga sp. TaxID=2614236 RepID=UPI0025EEC97F|nr:hypothetical protein [Sulfurivirga sp.]
MKGYSIDRSENGFTVYRGGQAIATFASAKEAIEAMRQFRDRPEQARHANVPPAIAAFKARQHHGG